MGTVGDAFRPVRQLLLIHTNGEQLEKCVDQLGDYVDGLARALALVRDRAARLEVFMDGRPLFPAVGRG